MFYVLVYCTLYHDHRLRVEESSSRPKRLNSVMAKSGEGELRVDPIFFSSFFTYCNSNASICIYLWIVQCLSVCSFDEEGEFWIHSPLPQIKFTLMTVTKGFISDSKTIAKVTANVGYNYTTKCCIQRGSLNIPSFHWVTTFFNHCMRLCIVHCFDFSLLMKQTSSSNKL